MSNLTKRKKDLFEMKSVVFKDISKQQSEKAQKKKTTLTTNESISRLGKSEK